MRQGIMALALSTMAIVFFAFAGSVLAGPSGVASGPGVGPDICYPTGDSSGLGTVKGIVRPNLCGGGGVGGGPPQACSDCTIFYDPYTDESFCACGARPGGGGYHSCNAPADDPDCEACSVGGGSC